MRFVSKKSSPYICNAIASLINASESVVILMIATREVGLNDAGVLSIAFTISNLMMNIGKFGVRNFQVTDVKSVFSFSEYLRFRKFTMIVMSVAFSIWLLIGWAFNGYSISKIIICICVYLLYFAEVYEDVYWGAYQKKDRLDVGAKIFSIRWIATISACCSGLYFTHNTISALLIAVCVDWILLWVLIGCSKSIIGEPGENSKDKLKNLFFESLPLALSSVLSYYIVNAPKYAIDGCLSEEIQACYGFVSMPIFVIGLINMVLYQPILVSMSNEWKESFVSKFNNRVNKQLVIIFLMSVLCIVGAWFVGIPVLSFIFATDLVNYKFELIVLLFGGMWLAITGFFVAILTIMRKLKNILFSYGIITVLSILFTPTAVERFGTKGAAMINMFLTFLSAIIFGILIFREINAVEAKENRNK